MNAPIFSNLIALSFVGSLRNVLCQKGRFEGVYFMASFEKKFEVLWSQLESSQHMRNIHYNVFATDARVA